MTSVGPGPGVAAGDIGDAKISEPANKRESPASFCNRDSRHHGMATPAPRTSTTAKANYPSHNALLARQSSRKPQYAPAGSSIPLAGPEPRLVRKRAAGKAAAFCLAVELRAWREVDLGCRVEPDHVPGLAERRCAVLGLVWPAGVPPNHNRSGEIDFGSIKFRLLGPISALPSVGGGLSLDGHEPSFGRVEHIS